MTLPCDPNVERLARQIAAWKMNLVKDRRGEHLPDDLWQQCIPAALAELNGDVVVGELTGSKEG